LVFVNDREDGSFLLVANSGKGNVPLGVVTTLFLTVRFISLLRGFDRTGWLVAVLTQNFLDVRGFIVVIVSILFGFTIAFRLLFANVEGECIVVMDDANAMSNECDEDPFGSLATALLSTFELTILGSYESSMIFDSNDILLASIIFVIAVTVVLVVALNALIAVLGDSFSRVQENVTANRRRERAELIVEYLSMMPRWQRKRIENNNQYFHVLLASDGHGDLLLHKDDWQGGINALKRELTELTETNNQMTQQAIAQLREELKEEVTLMMRNEVGAVLNEIFLEVKEISKSQRTGLLPPSKKVLTAVQLLQNNFTPNEGIQKNFAPFDGIKRTFLRPLPARQKGNQEEDNHQDRNNQSQQGNQTEANDDEEDEFSNLMSSATFG
jgi:F0F1-type ATP synthase membrane subunit b/b'